MKFFKKHFLIAAYLLFYFLAVAYKIIFQETPFYDWDESLYIQSGKEMIEKGFLLFPVWQGQPWLDKPPLVPFLYGVVIKTLPFVSPEISTRIFTLTVSVVILAFVYILYLRLLKDKFMATLSVAITSFTPIFFQRAQVVNLDSFLVLGWLGYVLFFDKAIVAFLFLLLGVFSKSLVGFYPAAIMFGFYIYLFLVKKIDFKLLKRNLTKITVQVLILMSWFVVMTFMFADFFRQHIIESHFRRVTSSIEFHFGTRTFYLDLIRAELGVFFWLSILGLILLTYWLWKNKFEPVKLLYSSWILPWFFFLNLTKTKIFWYVYPTLPQFAFLAIFPLIFFKKNKLLYYVLAVAALAFVFYNAFFSKKTFFTVYSKVEPHHKLSIFAREKCSQLYVLLPPQSRKDFTTLENLGLLITTSKWWGNHPSMIYYFGKKVNLVYDKSQMAALIPKVPKQACIVLDKDDLDLKEEEGLLEIKSFGQNLLLTR